MENTSIINKYKHYILLFLIFLFSSSLFWMATVLHGWFDQVMSVVNYLTWHNIFEFTSIFVSFGIFVVAYFTYDQLKNYRALFFGSVFFYIGIIDFFHTLSFKGMPEFFISNAGANRATTFWIASRLLGGIGLAAASFLPDNLKLKISKYYFLSVTIIAAVLIFWLVTYCPQALPAMYVDGIGLTQVKKNLEYLVALLFAVTMFKFIFDYQKTKEYSSILFALGMMLSIFSEFAFISYGSVYDIYNYLGHIFKLISFFIFFRIIFIHDVQIPCFELSKARNELKEHVENLDRLVEQRTLELKRTNNKLLQDLEYAKDIQKSLLPLRVPDDPEISFEARYFPAESVGGDFYNILRLDERNIGIYIGDVCGHGVSAAMLTVFMSHLIRTATGEDNIGSEIISPSRVLQSVYKSFNRTNFKEEMYIVLFYGIYNLDTREFTYASAGLNVNPLLIDGETGTISELEVKGFPICKFIEFYSDGYQDTTIKLKSGDKLVFYTDGMVEAESRAGEFFSQERLIRVLEKNKELDDAALSEILTREVLGFTENMGLKDDLTFILMHIK